MTGLNSIKRNKMTPKEKAEELVNKYSIWCWNEVVCDYEIAKQCALIAVDEIIDKDGYNNDYWKEVKQELEKL
jgi:hypothetical protein